MTEQEFRQGIRPLFERSPLIPVRLDLVNGQHFYLDTPRQIEFIKHGFRVELRGQNPVTLAYQDVSKATPLDEVPAQAGGMSYADFYAKIRPLFWAEPFRPYTLELRSGEKLTVESSGLLTLSGRFGTFLSKNPSRIVPFTYDQVARVYATEPTPVG